MKLGCFKEIGVTKRALVSVVVYSVFFPDFLFFPRCLAFLIEEPRISFHVFVYWSGHSS